MDKIDELIKGLPTVNTGFVFAKGEQQVTENVVVAKGYPVSKNDEEIYGEVYELIKNEFDKRDNKVAHIREYPKIEIVPDWNQKIFYSRFLFSDLKDDGSYEYVLKTVLSND